MAGLRLVLTLDEPSFGAEMHRVLSPSNAIQTPELLRGRAKQLDEIRRALYSPGRQIFVYGHRGVGKTSVAQTAAFQKHPADSFPIIVGCAPGSTCFSVVRDIAKEAFPADPRLVRTTKQRSFKFSFKGTGTDRKSSEEQKTFRLPESLNDAVRLIEYIAQKHSKNPVIVIDEFDQIRDKEQQNMFANLVKQVADKRIGVSIIFCGIGASLDDLFSAHLSAHRYFHPVGLERLPYDARFEIIEAAAGHLGISIDNTTRYRIAMISDGFPYYVHLICEKLFWRVYFAKNQGFVNGDLFEQALIDAAEALEPEIKKPYDKATKKYTNVREPILWALADGDELQRPSRDVWQSYLRIMSDLKQEPLDRTKFNGHMNNLKKSGSGSVFTATRAGWYEYTEKVVRGYARLKALQKGIILEREHPLQRKRHGAYQS
jgi:hypothetical protein